MRDARLAWLKAGGLASLLLLLNGGSSWAAQTITISQSTQMSFGTLAKPSSGSQTYVVHSNGSADTGTGTLLYGTTSKGVYAIKLTGSGSGTSTTIDIQSVSTGNAALTLGSFEGVYGATTIASFPRSGLALPGNGAGTTFNLGATATYTSSIPVGSLSPSFNIVVTLQ